jgi:hypothetical protein
MSNNKENWLLPDKIPISIHNVGIYFREFFDNKQYYESIVNEHELQDLGIHGKDGSSHRKGIYISNVNESKENDDEIDFNLLRCSTNLSGPTDNFRKTDCDIISKVQNVVDLYFHDQPKLNHVLAQTYHNSVNIIGKEFKAKISRHSDKTKDMPKNAVIAFCTFYKDFNPDGNCFNRSVLPQANRNPNTDDTFDYRYKHNTTVLTKLRFRLKEEVTDINLTNQFDITLYPNSVFIMSLHMNRLYTHEIIPSTLPVDKVPTRMGYIIRCSNTDAVYSKKEKQSYIIKSSGERIPLTEPTEEGIKKLKDLYYQENMTIKHTDYTDKFFFSMNTGDYLQPML